MPFTRIRGGLTFLIEQFWGRAARASNDSKRVGRPFYFLVIIPNPHCNRIPLVKERDSLFACCGKTRNWGAGICSEIVKL